MAPLFLYTLELEGGHWYVGTTSNPPQRLREHRGGRGSEWTRIHPPKGTFSQRYPLEKLECSPEEARLREDMKVKAVMLKEGIGCVRGGSYSRADFTRSDLNGLKKELFHANEGCLRCGRQSHWASNCFATTDIFGDTISDDEDEEWGQERERERTPLRQRGCRRCGRASHTEESCYAKTTLDGEPLDSDSYSSS